MVNVPIVATFASSHRRQLVKALNFQLVKVRQPSWRALELCGVTFDVVRIDVAFIGLRPVVFVIVSLLAVCFSEFFANQFSFVGVGNPPSNSSLVPLMFVFCLPVRMLTLAAIFTSTAVPARAAFLLVKRQKRFCLLAN